MNSNAATALLAAWSPRHLSARCNREIAVGLCFDEHESDVVLSFNLQLLAAAQVGHKPDGARVAIGPASSGRARKPPAKRVVSIHTPTCSIISHTRSR